jgi:nitrate reductase delta subunit
MMTYRVLARLLGYPSDELIAAAPECRAILAADDALPPDRIRAVARLIDEIASGDPLEIQERYVGLFDRVRSLSLHLFEHVHGESRDRGSAMVDLIELYRRHGLEVTPRELPDYLPLFLEFLSTLSTPEARAMLADTARILAAIRDRLRERGSSYAAIFEALLHLSGADIKTTTAAAGDDESPEALDRSWEETPVTFGPESLNDTAGRSACQRVDAMLARMNAM